MSTFWKCSYLKTYESGGLQRIVNIGKHYRPTVRVLIEESNIRDQTWDRVTQRGIGQFALGQFLKRNLRRECIFFL